MKQSLNTKTAGLITSSEYYRNEPDACSNMIIPKVTRRFISCITGSRNILMMLPVICCIIFPANFRVLQAQSIYNTQKDFSYMWWLKTIKKDNKEFGIKTSRYAISFDYKYLSVPHFSAHKFPLEENRALRETNEDSFIPGHDCRIQFGMNAETRSYIVQAYSQDIDNCQLIETGKYFHRRFINNLVDLNGCNLFKSGLEISSWPDRVAFVLKATPKYTLEKRGLFFDFTFPAQYSGIRKSGNIIALENPSDGSGFVILKSENTSEIIVSGTTISAKLNIAAVMPAGIEASVGMIIYPVHENIEAEINRISAQENELVKITAFQLVPSESSLKVDYDSDRGWYQIGLRNDGNISEHSESSNNRIERVKISFDNPSSEDKIVRLNFAKGRLSEENGKVFGITGISAILRDLNGNPLGIPIQLSKNWHTSGPSDEQYFRGPWYHGLCFLNIPAGAKFDLEYTSVNALWGSIPAASHAQLCLVGWGSNQQWDQSAIGSWGESITYEPDLDQAAAPVLDFRPLMVKDLKNQKWGWTGNMGGADFFNFTRISGTRSWHSRMRTQYKRYGPNLTEVTYAGTLEDNSMDFEYTASIGRSDDIVRGIYHIKLKVLKSTEFKDFAFFQLAAPTYHYTKSGTLAWGDKGGLKKQWSATIGGESRYITSKQEVKGEVPWFSFTDSDFTSPETNFLPANRGFVIRNWSARINGVGNVNPWFAEYNATGGHGGSSGLINITPPPDCKSFQPGDYLEAIIEVFQIPKTAADYYGPNKNLISALASNANSWKMVYREAIGNDLLVDIIDGGVLNCHYPVKIAATSNTVNFHITGGLGYVPVTITNVSGNEAPVLFKKVNGDWVKIDQSAYGNDFWQAEYNPGNNSWDITWNVNLDTPNDVRQTSEFRFESKPSGSTGISTNHEKAKCKIIPNPNLKGSFNVESPSDSPNGKLSVKITNMAGETLFQELYDHQKTLRVDSNLNSGIYLVTIKNGISESVEKMIVL